MKYDAQNSSSSFSNQQTKNIARRADVQIPVFARVINISQQTHYGKQIKGEFTHSMV